MIRSVIRKSTYKAIYRLLDKVSPLEFDCGLLCGAACCRDDQSTDDECCTECSGSFPQEDGGPEDVELGMELLPGEDKIHDRNDGWLTWSDDEAEDMDYPDSWHGRVFFVKCGGPDHCKREMRPIQCRTFPLAPHILDDGSLIMILNTSDELTYDCPLTDPEMAQVIDRRFVRASYTVWKRLVTDPLIRDLVILDSECRDTVAVMYDSDEQYYPGQLLWLGN